jgi:hypothetical protein
VPICLAHHDVPLPALSLAERTLAAQETAPSQPSDPYKTATTDPECTDRARAQYELGMYAKGTQCSLRVGATSW